MDQHVKTINCGGKLLDLLSPKVMGILNITPDSFFDGGKFSKEEQWLLQVEKMIHQGASIIDIGAVSTRPGSQEVDLEMELKRLIPAVKSVSTNFPDVIISIDTWRAKVAEKSVENGAHIINDISGGLFDSNMASTIGSLQVPYIMMHTGGRPDVMQNNPIYEDIVVEMIQFFTHQLRLFRDHGVHDIILDPGLGFGKTVDHNYQLLAKLSSFNVFDLPILVGVSRKSMIQKLIHTTAAESLNGSSVVHTIALLNGASILRVHDVKEAVEVVEIVKKTNFFLSYKD